jgi:glycosyltransferase involved in cell wall biosynthesis
MEAVAVYHNILSGGARKSIYDFVEVLRNDYIVDLYQLSSSEDEFYNLDTLIRKKYEYRFFPLLHKFFTNPYIYSPVLILDIFKIFRTAKLIAKEINSRKYKFVFINPDRYTQFPIIAKYIQCPTIVICHEPYRLFYEPRYDIDRKIGKIQHLALIGLFPFHQLLKWVGKIGIVHADALLANSYYSREYIYKAYKRWSTVTYLGIKTAEYPHTNKPTQNFVLSVGAINWRKSHELVVKALAHIKGDIRPRLVIIAPIVGNIKEQKRIEGIAKLCNVEISIEEKIPQDKLVDYFNSAITTVCASIMEPFGLVAIESMSCGTPVIAVNEAGYRETVLNGHTGYLVERNEEAIAEKILQLLLDKELRQRLGQNAMEYARKFWDWEAREKHLLSTLAKEVSRIEDRKKNEPNSGNL